MLHFPGESEKLLAMTKEQKKRYFRDIDLNGVDFEIKVADFGFSKKLKNKG